MLPEPTVLLNAVTANGAGSAFPVPSGFPYRSIVGTIEGDGAVSATVTLEGSIDGDNWVPALISLSLTGTDSDVKGGEDVSAYPLVRGRVASISGTDAAVTLRIAVSQ